MLRHFRLYSHCHNVWIQLDWLWQSGSTHQTRLILFPAWCFHCLSSVLAEDMLTLTVRERTLKDRALTGLLAKSKSFSSGKVTSVGPSYLLGQFLALLSGHRLLLHVVELGDGLGVVPEVNLEETDVTQATLLCLNHHNTSSLCAFWLWPSWYHPLLETSKTSALIFVLISVFPSSQVSN